MQKTATSASVLRGNLLYDTVDDMDGEELMYTACYVLVLLYVLVFFNC